MTATATRRQPYAVELPAPGNEPKHFAAIAKVAVEALKELTPREAEVCRLMAFGLKNHRIAKDLGISVKTLDIHRAAVKRKLKATTAVAVALTWLAGNGLFKN